MKITCIGLAFIVTHCDLMMPAKISGVFACAYNHLYNLDQQLLPEALEDPVSVTLVCGCAAG